MEFPDIASTFKSLGLAPNDESDYTPAYSCPAVKLPDGSFVMESRKIATALEKLQPEPSLLLDNDYPERAQSLVDRILYSLGPGMMYRIPDMLLDTRGAEWYYEERKKITGGLPITDFADKFDWDTAGGVLAELRGLLAENANGPFVVGKEPSYADLIIVSLWKLWSKVDKGDLVDRTMAFDESIPKHWGACEKWFERDDH